MDRERSRSRERTKSRARSRNRERRRSRVNMENMEEVLIQVNRMVGCIGAKVDITDCNNNGFNELKKKLYVIERYLVANKTVRVLEECVKDLKDV